MRLLFHRLSALRYFGRKAASGGTPSPGDRVVAAAWSGAMNINSHIIHGAVEIVAKGDERRSINPDVIECNQARHVGVNIVMNDIRAEKPLDAQTSSTSNDLSRV